MLLITLKKNLSESACLAYYDPSKELVIQVDSSKHGLGAVLLQDGRRKSMDKI